MKKVISLFLVLVMCLSLCACGGGKSDFSAYDAAKVSVASRGNAYCGFNYADVRYSLIDSMIMDDNGDGTYTCTGYIAVHDNYGDVYKGKYKAVVKVDIDAETANCTSFEMVTTPRKE